MRGGLCQRDGIYQLCQTGTVGWTGRSSPARPARRPGPRRGLRRPPTGKSLPTIRRYDQAHQDRPSFTGAMNLATFTSFQGRVGPSVYFVGLLLLCIPQVAVTALLTLVAKSLSISGAAIVCGILSMIMPAPLVTKRAHDLGKTGWWVLGWVAVWAGAAAMIFFATVAMFISLVLGGAMFIAGGAGYLAAAYQLIVRLTFFPGTPRSNDFGPPAPGLRSRLNSRTETTADTAQSPGQIQISVAGRTAAVVQPRPMTPSIAGFGRRQSA